MTYGQLFMKLNPNVKVVENGTCVWIYFDSVNYDTFRTEWWNKEIPDATLKAQEPRVLQLNEIHRGMTVWLEDVDKSELLLAIGGASCHYAKTFITENDRSIAAEDSEYNIRWRAWTSRPTDEQRKAVEWDE